jgi:hypothetical protein
MSDVRTDVPAEFERVVLRCLQKDRTKRYANVGRLAVDLIPFAPKRARQSVERIARLVESTGSGPIDLPASLPPLPSEDVRENSKTTVMLRPLDRLLARRKPLVLVLALASIAALGFGVWWLMPAKTPEPAVAQLHAQVVVPESAPLAPAAVAASAPSASASPSAPSTPAAATTAAQARTPAPKRTPAAPPLRRTPRAKKAASSTDDDIWGSRR